MHLILNEKILKEAPTSEQIREAFELINNSKDVISLHADNRNYIEAKRFAFGGYELKHLTASNIFISELNCIKEEIVIDIFHQYSSRNDNAIKIIKWKKQEEQFSSKKIKNVALIIFIVLLLFLRFGGNNINKKVLTSLENGRVKPLLFFTLILLIIIVKEWKLISNYKIIEGHKKFYATIPPLLLFLVVISWLMSLF